MNRTYLAFNNIPALLRFSNLLRFCPVACLCITFFLVSITLGRFLFIWKVLIWSAGMPLSWYAASLLQLHAADVLACASDPPLLRCAAEACGPPSTLAAEVKLCQAYERGKQRLCVEFQT